ncbi:MAG: single-stranded DNA-binding protein [Oscillospiraceae bacterium]|nr:single-stranded DNA-binding protein [Oscillospiraceae bacterium]
MNKVILIGRLTKDPDVRRSNDGDPVARYTLAVDRNKDEADFISCVAFKKSAEFAEKYLQKGTKILVEGRIRTGSYEKNGTKIYTTDVIADRHEFVESKKAAEPEAQKDYESFMSFTGNPDELGLPFN